MQKKLNKFFKDYDSEIKKVKARSLSDSELGAVSGGVGGANEATCPVCGDAMPPNGDGTWSCASCNVLQFLSDAEYIQVYKLAKEEGKTEGLVKPVWGAQFGL